MALHLPRPPSFSPPRWLSILCDIWCVFWLAFIGLGAIINPPIFGPGAGITTIVFAAYVAGVLVRKSSR